MKQLLSLLFISCFLINNSIAQDCQVALETIKGTYAGECQNGKASGKGKAVGADTYEGDFINGYPEGKGMYTWKDGHYYIGMFKKGKMEGAGDMYYESASGKDSVITGFWKKDKYVGLYEKAFVVMSTTSRINRIDGRLSKKGGIGTINFTTTQQSAGTGAVSIIPAIGSFAVISGQYMTKTTSALPNSMITRLQQIDFPFRAIFYYNNGEYFEMIFNEVGDYDININLL
jgi:hypothetical protein